MPQRTRPLVLIHASSQGTSLVHERLVGKGFAVLEAPKDDLLDLFVEFRPDMVLLEYRADDKTIEEQARKLRNTDLGQVVPIILFGAAPGPNPVDIVSMGADQFAALPLDDAWLEEKRFRLGGRRGRGQHGPGAAEPFDPKSPQVGADKAQPQISTDGAHPGTEKDSGPAPADPAQSVLPGPREPDPAPHPPQNLETRLDLFAQAADEESGDVLGAISDVLSPGDLPDDQDIDIDDLEIETTIPGIVDAGPAVLQDDTGESDLDISEDTDQDQIWKDSRTGRLGKDDSAAKPAPARPPSYGAVSLPPWQVSTDDPEQRKSTSPTSPQRLAAGHPGAAFEPTHLAKTPSSTEVITDGHPATPEQDTVVGLKWKQQERRGRRPLNQAIDSEKSQTGDDDAVSSTGRSSVQQRRNMTNRSDGRNYQNRLADSLETVNQPESETKESAGPAEPNPSTDEGGPVPQRPDEKQFGPRDQTGDFAKSRPLHGPWIPRPTGKVPDLPVSLDDVRPIELFTALASRKTSSCLKCSNGGTDIFFKLEHGLLAGAACSSKDLSFADWAVRLSLLTDGQARSLPSHVVSDIDRLYAALLSQGILTDRQLANLYRDWTGWLFYEVAGWRKGRIEQLDPDFLSPPVAVTLDWPKLVCEAVRRKYGPSLVLSLTGGPDARRVWTSEQAMETALNRLDLPVSDRRALILLTEGFPLAECARRSDMEESDLAGLVHGLDLLGMLTEPDRKADLPATLPFGSPKAQAARIEAKLDQVRQGDYYSLLGLRPGAGLREIRSAYEHMRQSFDDSALSEEIRLRYSKELAVVRTVLDEAVAVLTHPRYAALYAEAFDREHK